LKELYLLFIFIIDNVIFKVDSGGTLISYENSKNNLSPYYYKGDIKDANNKKIINGYLHPLKKWIKFRSSEISSQLNISIPSKAPSNSKYFEPEYETYNSTPIDTTTNIIKPTQKSKLQISDKKCGLGVVICTSGLCCS